MPNAAKAAGPDRRSSSVGASAAVAGRRRQEDPQGQDTCTANAHSHRGRIRGMAFMYVTVGISARPDSEAREVRLLVDTGAFYSMVPRIILEGLGIAPAYREKLRVADGRTVERDAGYAFLHYADRPPGPTIVVFAEPEDTLVLGVHTLEGLGLQVDPRSGTITAMDVIPYYAMAEA